jgi:cellulose synthase/poly-beta-1,6-N-acetylglucosamine synthase-like glycosyltransferase
MMRNKNDQSAADLKGPHASLIISVYQNATYLDCILNALQYQTFKSYEVIVSEDGQDKQIQKILEPYLVTNTHIRHLTQPDNGFRKNRALNRAVTSATTNCLIFIDGDCVPHSRFIESHVRHSNPRQINAGRRVELGRQFSQKLVQTPSLIENFSNSRLYSFMLPRLILDQIKNPESGYYSKFVHHFARQSPLSLVGCNFSTSRKALYEINGFNEDYEAPGIGEDTDMEWRFLRAGYRVSNIKFLTPLFHLWHPRSYLLSEQNRQIYEATKSKDQWYAHHGLVVNRPDCDPASRTAK